MTTQTAASGFQRSSEWDRLPAAPKDLAVRISSMARSDSAGEWQIKTPLPRARPSALTAQRPSRECANFLAAVVSRKVPALAVGIPYFSMKFWEKTLEDSN